MKISLGGDRRLIYREGLWKKSVLAFYEHNITSKYADFMKKNKKIAS